MHQVSMNQFHLHRLSDGLTYRFDRFGRHTFRRADDPAMTINWEGPWGWLARLPENGVVAGRPWDILPAHQVDTAPPQGIWVSRKGNRCYAYRLEAA